MVLISRRGIRTPFEAVSEEATSRVAVGQGDASQRYVDRQAEWEQKRLGEEAREAEARAAKRSAERAEEKARKDAFDAARAREDAHSPFKLVGPQSTPRDMRICLAKLFVDVWYDTLTGVERIDGLNGSTFGEQIDKQTLGTLLVRMRDKWDFKPPIGLLEKVVREKARTTGRNGVVDWLLPPAASQQDTGLDTWLTCGLGAADTPLNRAVARTWMIDAVRCARHPELTPNIILKFDGCDPRSVADALTYGQPPVMDFLLSVMIDCGKGKHRSARRLPIRCKHIDLGIIRHKLDERWSEASFYEEAGESTELDKQIEDANAAFERTTNPFVPVLAALLNGSEGKVRTIDVVQALGLSPNVLDDNRDPHNGMINRAMDLLGWGHRRAVRWRGQVVKGWGKGASTAALAIAADDYGGWHVEAL